jgi:menaquinone-dependent protoporphyrinogen oxidase
MVSRIAVVYATCHGHVREIASYLANVAAIRGMECTPFDVTAAEKSGAPAGFDGLIVAGSVHFARHQRSLGRFVRRESPRWTMPTAFVSISSSAATLEGRGKAQQYAREFLRDTGWQPDSIFLAAGALPYTRYDPLTRLAMKFASRIAGLGTDVTRDYVYTNWNLVDAFMHDFIDRVERYTSTRSETPDLTGASSRCPPHVVSSS